mgnify:CR=1 FL=1
MNAAAEINRNQPSLLGMHMNWLGEWWTNKEFQHLLLKLRDRDWRIRAAAARALGEIGDERAVEPLIAVSYTHLTLPTKA